MKTKKMFCYNMGSLASHLLFGIALKSPLSAFLFPHKCFQFEHRFLVHEKKEIFTLNFQNGNFKFQLGENNTPNILPKC